MSTAKNAIIANAALNHNPSIAPTCILDTTVITVDSTR